MSFREITVIGVVTLTWGMTAFAGTREFVDTQLKLNRDAEAVHSPPIRSGVARPAELPVEIAKVRLEFPKTVDNENSAVLKFQMSNRSSSTLRDIVFEASLLEKPLPGHLDTSSLVLAGPFVIRGKMVLDPGFTADWEIFLRDVSPTCSCAAKVRVLSFRSISPADPPGR